MVTECRVLGLGNVVVRAGFVMGPMINTGRLGTPGANHPFVLWQKL